MGSGTVTMHVDICRTPAQLVLSDVFIFHIGLLSSVRLRFFHTGSGITERRGMSLDTAPYTGWPKKSKPLPLVHILSLIHI